MMQMHNENLKLTIQKLELEERVHSRNQSTPKTKPAYTATKPSDAPTSERTPHRAGITPAQQSSSSRNSVFFSGLIENGRKYRDSRDADGAPAFAPDQSDDRWESPANHFRTKVKTEPGQAKDEHENSRYESETDMSASDTEGGWTKLNSRKSKAYSIDTTGEMSDWKRTKLYLKDQIQQLKCDQWVGALRDLKTDWKNTFREEYPSIRRKYRSRDIEFYKVLVASASSKKPESTRATAAQTAADFESVPWGHGALLYLHFENLFENMKKTDPTYSTSPRLVQLRFGNLCPRIL